jgi:hypothetical protein
MSGALNSVFGGGGLGAVLNVVSMVFPPAALASSAVNLLTGGIGQAVGGAMQQLTQSFGMPKFVGDMVKNLADQVLGGMQKPSDPACDAHVGGQPGIQDFMKNFIKDLCDKIIENTRKNLDNDDGCGDAKGGKGKDGKGGAVSAGSWLQAIAKSMGTISGDKAAKMVGLSQEMADLNSEGGKLADAGKGIDKGDSQGISANQSQQQQNARDFSIKQSEFQAASQEFSILQNTFSNALKSIGEGLTTMGRKG